MKQAGWLLVVVAACAHTVSQDKATGPDGRIKGAKPVALQDGEAKTRGIVTYPGGDRVDWKALELPAGQKGTLDLQLSWQAPRPGGQLAFDVFDQWNTPVTTSANRRSRSRSATIDQARGKYFVRVYAPRRSDAGEYRLVVNFKVDDDGGNKKPEVVIPDPPKLPGIPEPAAVCEPFDVNNKVCRNECPDFGAPPGWPGCADKERKEAERKAREEADKNKPPPPKAVMARILHYGAGSDGVTVTIGIGTTAAPALDKTWRVEVLGKASGNPLTGGSLVIVSVGKTQTIAKTTTLTTDQLSANPQVRLSPPGSP